MRTCLYASERSEAMRPIVECKGGEETVRGILFNSAQNNVRPAPYTVRVLRNAFSEKWAVREHELLQPSSTIGPM